MSYQNTQPLEMAKNCGLTPIMVYAPQEFFNGLEGNLSKITYGDLNAPSEHSQEKKLRTTVRN